MARLTESRMENFMREFLDCGDESRRKKLVELLQIECKYYLQEVEEDEVYKYLVSHIPELKEE